MREFRKLYPDHKLILGCRAGFEEPFLAAGLVDEVISVNKTNSPSVRAFRKKLLKYEYDVVLSPHESMRSGLLVQSLKANKKVGFKKWWNAWIFDSRVERPMQRPDALRQLQLLAPLNSNWNEILGEVSVLNITDNNTVGPWPSGSVPTWSQMRIDHLLPEFQSAHAGATFLSPGSVWPTKRWGFNKFVELGKRLSEEGRQIIVTGGRDERALCESVQKQIPGALLWAGEKSLLESLQEFRFGSLMVTNDSGAMHMAACVGLPVVSVFGPTTLSLGYRPWQEQAIVVQKDLSCRPCGRHGSKKCPIGTHDCMKQISVDSVLDAAKTLSH